MIYITWDKHADFREVFYFCYANETTLDDILIVLGDASINYYANEKDNALLLYWYISSLILFGTYSGLGNTKSAPLMNNLLHTLN